LLPLFNCALPEHEAGVRSPHVGHPGCFATAVLLAAVPAMSADLVEPDFYVTGITGSTGSGRSPSAGTHHPERHSNLYAYKPLEHRHAPEIEALIGKATGKTVAVNFVPHSGPFARGIYATLQAKLKRPLATHDARDVFRQFYSHAEFVHALDGMPRLKDVVASNHANLSVACSDNTLVISCAIDNLVKGAAGGAMQWMNRLWSLPEADGLDAPAPGWT
jgi:N-acetyl-gamma-glutamyl-phosphate reductase